MKNFIISLIHFFSFINLSFSQDEEVHSGELIINNYSTSSRTITVHIYAVSMVFNGLNEQGNGKRYNLVAMNPSEEGPYIYRYINGRNTGDSSMPFSIGPSGFMALNHDVLRTNGGTPACVGFGKYKMVIEWGDGSDTCTVEWDSGYPVGGIWANDLKINFRDDDPSEINGNPRLLFQWDDASEYLITYVNKEIVAWDQQYYQGTTRRLRDKDYGNFIYNSEFGNTYTVFPQDSRMDCGAENQNFEDNRSGNLTLNLAIDKDVYTRGDAQFFDQYPIYINVNPNVFLSLRPNRIINMIDPFDPDAYTNLIVQGNGYLILYVNSKIIIGNKNKVNLKYNSKLSLANNSEIRVKQGGIFCNEGAQIVGPGKIIFEGGWKHQLQCGAMTDFLAEDSVKIILEDSAIVELPDNYTLRLKGDKTSLTMHPGSKIIFGENSKLVIEDSADVIAKDAVFTSVDSTKTWDGIYMSGVSLDTISGCKIINSTGGINLIDKDPLYAIIFDGQYQTIIKDCEFVVTCDSAIQNAIFISNSKNILISNNSFYSNHSNRFFGNGIYMEYCPAGKINIIDNEINNCVYAITAIQTSPYIARNVMNGISGSGQAFFLDNSNGTIKHNQVSGYDKNIFAIYSNPYLLKNIFDNDNDHNIYLEQASVLIMHPLVDGEITYWYGGDNVLTGDSYYSKIFMNKDSYPSMGNGYNKFYLGNSQYYINGEIPSELEGSLHIEANYWDPEPETYYFDLTGGVVDYSPTENGASIHRDYNTIDLIGIGFGLYDTIYINDQSDNAFTTNLYISAINLENQGNYPDAIEEYMEIVSLRDTAYMRYSIPRIYNCYEKAGFFGNDINEAEDYFSNLMSDTSFSNSVRGVSKDFYLKTKFRNNSFSIPISEYNSLYVNNPNTALGLHGLLNKTIIEALSGENIIDNTGMNSSYENIKSHKRNVSLILNNYSTSENSLTNNVINISDFRLTQNYPNPFNPKTVITFSIPAVSLVKLNVYDITGRLIKVLTNEIKEAGTHNVTFDGTDLSSGVYFYRLVINSFGEAGSFDQTKRMVMVK